MHVPGFVLHTKDIGVSTTDKNVPLLKELFCGGRELSQLDQKEKYVTRWKF